ncbi:MAG: formylglycine-generating enzyme family protein [Calditrichaeota bacterium]|nr:formylglycine-generating enzyme family protein [Calditrichota bacterium]MCB0295184.1 formylglycine-generating enzyme family protein [Calditrichota bacterium]MCB0305288.1 formylglycine-generating enzyme family protein [Calditrichota bacterium]
MVRPMLLSNIDYFVDDEKVFHDTYQIYETLIDKWIEREARKRKHLSGKRVKFKQDLRQYSRLVALEIYRRRNQADMLYLDKAAAIDVARQNNLDLDDYEITGQSLLTRDAEGNWKFAHKSILEYFIAREALANLNIPKEFDFTGMDMAEQFYHERIPEFVFIKGGTFLMGSPVNEVERRENETQHLVEVSDFYIGKYPVTVGQFEMFISESNYQTDADKDGGSNVWSVVKWRKKAGVNWRCDVKGDIQKNHQHPVIHVSWNDAAAYCQWLSQKSNARLRLPTEAEWEYACRAGTTTPFYTGENLTTDQANYNGNYPYNKNPKGKYPDKTTPVGSYPPNAWGLCDMHGNVWEWCEDWYDDKYYDACKQQGTVVNPTGPEKGSRRVLRGGSWRDVARNCRSANRSSYRPANRNHLIGFRLVFVP